MKSTFASVLFGAGLALGVGGCAAGTQGPAQDTRAAQPSVDPQQQRIASTTFALENAFDVQFVKGQVDPDALQPMVLDVLQAMPEPLRAKAKTHMYDVISRGQKAASEMTPEARAKLAAPVAADKLTPEQVDYIGGWGWGPALGIGGFGVGFGGLGLGYGASYGTTSVASYGTAYGAGFGYPGIGWGGAYGFGYPGVGYGAYALGYPGVGYGAYGLGLGCAGLGWGGLGAFGWPGFYGGWGGNLNGGWNMAGPF